MDPRGDRRERTPGAASLLFVVVVVLAGCSNGPVQPAAVISATTPVTSPPPPNRFPPTADPHPEDWNNAHVTHVEQWGDNAACSCDPRTGRSAVGVAEADRVYLHEYERLCQAVCEQYRIRPCARPRLVCHIGTDAECLLWVREGCSPEDD